MKYIIKPAAVLFLTAVIVMALLGVVHRLTIEPIERQRQRTREAAMKEVLPSTDIFQKIFVETPGSITAVYKGFSGDVLTGIVMELSRRGYSGNIDLMVGISLPDEKISGMRILRHTETPGLGALAVREDFFRRFDNRPLIPLGVTRASPLEHEIIAITGATITTRAITEAVNEAIEWYLNQMRNEE